MRHLSDVVISMARVSLEPGGEKVTTGRVKIDGAEIEGGVRSLILTAGVDDPIVLELNLAIAEFDAAGIQLHGVRYGLSKSTIKALLELGWTPPKEE